MNEFEFLAVLLSIIFGLAITQVLSGVVRLFYEDRVDDTRLAWALSVGTILIVNWWGFFRWSDAEQWRFENYLLLILWATVHFATAATLFPKDFVARIHPERERRVFLIALLTLIGVDVIETGVRGGLFEPWFLLPVMALWAFVALTALFVRRESVQRSAAWFMFVSLLAWALGVRNILQS